MELNEHEASVLHSQLARLLEQAPADLTQEGAPLWMGRVHAILVRAGARSDAMSFSVKSSNTITLPGYRENQRNELIIIAYRTLAALEQRMPSQSAGTFINPGSVFDAYSAISKVLSSATVDILVVDPYLDEVILTEYGSSVRPGVMIRLMTDPTNYRKSLLPVLARWAAQYGDKRPIELRLSEPRRLHDRAIFVDSTHAWTLTQSIKDFAKRSPGHISRADAIAREKQEAYEALWTESTPPA
ncbi:phosphatidylserine/phosphatidylglycerophosphate/cardiolipin synthase family protein [Achromobacter piechaudii]|uniref:phosphatidylserine/phosphatidylglycerophosphate/ cardiolipin synthase family protein n=1 Tax=Achromobacter piechaudii TaxID=72556 RepID=UPI0014667396|nr:phosphatidylserine/phosphatidylglycerophosphate/cardiolipin synthase family protein [Achromobacter piechaudii]CAB3959590.1 hypothetical protein LMG6103_05842 [Achromobacter piechaudii]